MGKEKETETATFEWVADNKKDLIYATANDFLKECSVINKENIDEAINLATYFYERVYEDKKSVKEDSEFERDKMTIKYLEETLNTVRSMLDKLCQKYKK